jgi:hypothetical protein
MCVQSTFWQQEDPAGSRLIVHLWNGLNTTSDHGLQEVETPLREESVPIHGIELKMAWKPAGRVEAQPENITLEPREENGTWIVTVPPVAVHSAVVIPRPRL